MVTATGWRRGNRKGLGARPAERYDRRRVVCPNCGRPGELIVGAGLYPYVEHGMDQEIKITAHTDCWIGRDHPLVLELLARRAS